MSTRVASDGHVNGAGSSFRHWVLVSLIVLAAFASRGRARVSTAGAFGAALEHCIMLVGATHRVRRHARVAAALLVAGAVGGVTIVGASLQHALGNQFCHSPGHGRLGGCLWRLLFDGA